MTEATSLDLDKYKINVCGKEYPVRFIFNGYNKDWAEAGFSEDEVKKRIESLLKSAPWNNKSLYKNLFDQYSRLWKDINDDSYFNGKKISTPQDIHKSLGPKFTIMINNTKCHEKMNFSALLGECWWDDEHGFSIVFPNDKVVKVTDINIKNANYKPVMSFLGQHSNWY